MSTFGSILANVSPKWLAFFQQGQPMERGIYVATGKKGGQRKLYGPIKSRAYASVLDALTFNRPGAWPQPNSSSSRSSAFGSEYDASELEDLVNQPDGYDYSSVKVLPVTKLKLAMSEDEALQNLRALNMVASQWWRFFGFECPENDEQLFPFVDGGT